MFILPNTLKGFTKDKPVLGSRVSIPSNAKIPHSSFKDKNFYACVIGNLNDSKINNKTNRTFSYKATDAELKALKNLDCIYASSTPSKINNTTGLEKIPNLISLNLGANNLTSINLTNQTKLTFLYLNHNNLTSINLTNQKNLTDLHLYSNKLTSINLINQIKLTYLNLGYNNLDSLNLTNLKNLRNFNIEGNFLSYSKLRMLTSNYVVSGNNINVNTTNRATILNNIYPFASKIKINKYIETASGSKVASGDYKDGDKVIVESGVRPFSVTEVRRIVVTSNTGKVTSAQWVERIGDRQATARLKFKSNMAQDWYNLVCYTYDGKKVVDNINMASTAKSDGYRYSNARYITYMKKCYLSGVVWSNGKNVWGPATLIK